jgi:alkylhydroperoxidase/carboxymuconolactone decarboxylase family protein YurZ
MSGPESSELPPSGAGQFARSFPEVWDAYAALGKSAAEAGPLEADTRRLIKLALAMGAGSEGAVHSHTRQALAEGQSVESLQQVAVLAITTLGFPAAVAALSWITDVTDKRGRPNV